VQPVCDGMCACAWCAVCVWANGMRVPESRALNSPGSTAHSFKWEREKAR
jgi:hypothetical protein